MPRISISRWSRKDLPELKGRRARQELPVPLDRRVQPVQTELKDQPDQQVRKARKVYKELQVHQGLQVHQELRVYQGHRVHPGHRAHKVRKAISAHRVLRGRPAAYPPTHSNLTG